jgi:hypothetical protein
MNERIVGGIVSVSAVLPSNASTISGKVVERDAVLSVADPETHGDQRPASAA